MKKVYYTLTKSKPYLVEIFNIFKHKLFCVENSYDAFIVGILKNIKDFLGFTIY
jgi:hypothetical protein